MSDARFIPVDEDLIIPNDEPYSDPVFATRAERVEFDAQTAAAKAIKEWIDHPDVNACLIGCTPSMLSQIAINAYRKARGHE